MADNDSRSGTRYDSDAIRDYVQRTHARHDAALAQAFAVPAEMPAIQVGPNEGKLLFLLARMIGATKIVEVGTLAGYSAIHLARALPPGGHVHTIEFEPSHAKVARANIDAAGLGGAVTIHVGAGTDVLPTLDRDGPFDLVFIDADKENAAAYFDASVRLGRPGTVIIVDNVVRAGEIRDPASTDPRVQGTQRLLERMAADPRVDWTVLQTVGRKGHDGWAVAWVRSPDAAIPKGAGPSAPSAGRHRSARARGTRSTHAGRRLSNH